MSLSPLTAQISALLASPLHAALPLPLPLPRFPVLHAVRVSILWAALSRHTRRPGTLQDAFGYLVLAWAGNTTLALLLSLPPAWLVSPTPWLVYPPVYLLSIPTGLSPYIVRHCPQALLHTVGAAVDGLSRGVTIASIAGMLEASGKFHPHGHDVSAWTYTLLSTCAIASGGFLVSLFSLHEASYRLSVPSVFRSGVGVWGTMDVWAAALAGLGYWVMVSVPLMDGLAARTVCVLFLGGILILRAVRTQLVSTSSKNR
ncbi:hypothetical protein I305_04052 [Cryptococcus gattii E566]|uniref:Uncharacterized protein n=2 Tax=Cryptococcus gattii TaxID=37769 RepID=E6R550_CRYGW|nr:uncharacterized protein CGB_D9600W [Cryptococcus gattii WM276]ADV22177.1 hypothetical protein CNJ00190 [Cryptococcus gattii WM276]KIR80337.1 hypothetical protein I306_02594 [Cryptococcus gattii EJB2]KIY33656.1 hypothetical protein I305_04052 [Cryptococcus gattii E566]KJE00304.1 hypothetical protein I311_06100 [Cryptococcus gattii NT-10]